MQPFTTVLGPAAALPAANVDTDVIMPKQFLKGIDRNGLAQGALHGLRFAEDGTPRADFVLNRPEWADARFLVVGPNFGCGSSREHAVWGLMQLGIRALIGTTFAGIFGDNAANNGLLLIRLEETDLATLRERALDAANNTLTVDLPGQTVSTVATDTRSRSRSPPYGRTRWCGVSTQSAAHSTMRPIFAPLRRATAPSVPG